MTSYAFKEWLTFEEAAGWLSEFSGSSFSAVDIERAAMESRILTHYWPIDGSEVGVFSFDDLDLYRDIVNRIKSVKGTELSSSFHMYESSLFFASGINFSQCEFKCRLVGPAPIHNYKEFMGGKKFKSKYGDNWHSGISLFMEGQELPCGLYLFDDDLKPLCLMQGSFQVLVHIEDLAAFNSKLPIPKRRKPHGVSLIHLESDDNGALFSEARSNVEWRYLPEQSQFKDDIDKGSPVSNINAKSELLQTLAFSIHLIADLAEKLDAYQALPSEKLKLKHGAKPNIKNIAAALSEKAKALNYKGHGFGAEGFRKKLSKALNEIQ